MAAPRPTQFFRPRDIRLLAGAVAHALAQIGGSILIWRGDFSLPDAVVRSVVAIEPTTPRLAPTFQVYAWNFYLWAAFLAALCLWLALARRTATGTLTWAERVVALAFCVIVASPAVTLFFNLFPQTYVRRANNVLTSASAVYVFEYAAKFAIGGLLIWLLVLALGRSKAAKAAPAAPPKGREPPARL